MRLAGPAGPLPPAEHVGAALKTASERLGHRPAITVWRRERRDEQGFVSLARWAAKGAHLLEIECLLDAGDRLRLVAPPGWPAAAVCLAAWWAGVTVTVGPGDAPVAVVHEPSGALPRGEVYTIGDGVDGSPRTDAAVEPWPVAVQAFPDQPPPWRANPDLLAVEVAGASWTHQELLTRAAAWGSEGVLGVEADTPPERWLPALVRPLVSGQATLVLVGVSRTAVAGEPVRMWA